MRGVFITFEGGEGSGKSTQLSTVLAHLRSTEREVLETCDPGGTCIGEQIRRTLLDRGNADMDPMAELFLYEASRAQLVREIIRPALQAGRVVVCDRFTDSTEAYQGGGRELGSQVVLDMHRLICGGLQPDLTLLLLPGLRVSLARARHRNDRVEAETGSSEGRFESEKDAFFRRVWEKYHEIAAREPDRVVLIEGDLSIDEVHEQILEAVAERIVAKRV